jgi:hypothetical protein
MVTLSTDQQTAADEFMSFLMENSGGEMVIQGHAGTGKSFLTSYLLDLIKTSSDLLKLLTTHSSDVNVILTATTNKAAKVLSNMAGEPAQTIHSLLSLKVTNNYQTGSTGLRQTKDFKIINNTLIIIDEASMVNSQLLKIIRASTKDCKVLYIMDSYQLAPIKENSCPAALVFNKSVLSTIQRQAAGNPIIAFAEGYRKVLDGQPFPPITAQGVEILRVDGPTFQSMIDIEFVRDGHTVDDGKILAWTNEKVHAYNKHVRALYAQTDKFEDGEWVTTNKPILGMHGKVLATTDSIIQIAEIYPYTVQHIDVECWEITVEGGITVYLPLRPGDVKNRLAKASRIAKKDNDWGEYFRIKEGFADLRPVHASTVHKSQGSTYRTVFIDLADIGKNSKASEVARLMYVAVTRASEKIVLYGALGHRYGD